MKYYSIQSVYDEVLKPNPIWRDTKYSSIECSLCHDILKQYRNVSLSVSVDEEVHGPKAGLWEVGADILRKDLLDNLLPIAPNLTVGSVVVRGVVSSSHFSVIVPSIYRVAFNGDAGSKVYTCPRCGRRCEMLLGRAWLPEFDITRMDFISGVAGAGFILPETLAKDIWRKIPGIRLVQKNIKTSGVGRA